MEDIVINSTVIKDIAITGLKYGLIIGFTTMIVSKGVSYAWKLLIKNI